MKIEKSKTPSETTYELPWAPPGTVRDSLRILSLKISNDGEMESFYIKNHGVFILDWHRRDT